MQATAKGATIGLMLYIKMQFGDMLNFIVLSRDVSMG